MERDVGNQAGGGTKISTNETIGGRGEWSGGGGGKVRDWEAGWRAGRSVEGYLGLDWRRGLLKKI